MRRAALAAAFLVSGCASMNQINDLMRDYSGDVPGASVLVVREGKVVFRRSYGLANVEERIAAMPDTHYRLASVTKQFTAAAILILAQRERPSRPQPPGVPPGGDIAIGRDARSLRAERPLSLDDPIRKHLPSLPEYADAITIRHLLTHTSGLIDYEDIIPAGTTKQLKDIDVLHLLETQQSTYFTPGTKYQYSNTGYAFLALIVERVSGQSLAHFLRDNIFLPLGMKTTVAHEEGITTVGQRAYGYSQNGASWERTDQSLTSAVLGDGGIYTSVDELVHWLQALDAGEFAEALVPRVDTGNAGVRYGFGWRIGEENGRKVISHTGETRGFRNALVRLPDDKLAIVILTNRNEGKPYDIAMKIAALFFVR